MAMQSPKGGNCTLSIFSDVLWERETLSLVVYHTKEAQWPYTKKKKKKSLALGVPTHVFLIKHNG